jgi:hypothetical protein
MLAYPLKPLWFFFPPLFGCEPGGGGADLSATLRIALFAGRWRTPKVDRHFYHVGRRLHLDHGRRVVWWQVAEHPGDGRQVRVIEAEIAGDLQPAPIDLVVPACPFPLVEKIEIPGQPKRAAVTTA